MEEPSVTSYYCLGAKLYCLWPQAQFNSSRFLSAPTQFSVTYDAQAAACYGYISMRATLLETALFKSFKPSWNGSTDSRTSMNPLGMTATTPSKTFALSWQYLHHQWRHSVSNWGVSTHSISLQLTDYIPFLRRWHAEKKQCPSGPTYGTFVFIASTGAIHGQHHTLRWYPTEPGNDPDGRLKQHITMDFK